MQAYLDCKDRLGGCHGFAEMSPHTLFFKLPKYDAYNIDWKEHDFILTVESPATGMRGRKQTLVSKNVYCRTPEGFSKLTSPKWVILNFLKLIDVVIIVIGLFIGRRFIKKMVLLPFS